MAGDHYDQLVQEFLGKKHGRPQVPEQGIQVIAVNPKFSDDPSEQRSSSLTKINPPEDAVLVYVDRPQTMEAVDDCVAARCCNGIAAWLRSAHDALDREVKNQAAVKMSSPKP